MLSKELKKYVSEGDIKQFKEVFKNKFTNEQYLLFLRKFRGSMIYRGKSSLSYKYMDSIWFIFKKFMKEQEKRQSIHLAFKKAIFNMIPILSISNVKRGKRVQVVPVLLKQQRRIVLINKWLLSSQKNKSNVRGIDIEIIAKLLLDALRKKGNSYVQKMENHKRAINARYILLRPRDKSIVLGFNDLQDYVLRKLRERYGTDKKEEIITDIDRVMKLLSTFKFLWKQYRYKYYRYGYKRKKIKYNSESLRKYLRQSWDKTSVEKVYTMMDYLHKSSEVTNNIALIDKKAISEYVLRYYRVWKKRKGII